MGVEREMRLQTAYLTVKSRRPANVGLGGCGPPQPFKKPPSQEGGFFVVCLIRGVVARVVNVYDD
jgi:hypothetical protein